MEYKLKWRHILKRYCKEIDVTSVKFIKQSIMDCLKNKASRKEVIKYINKYYKHNKYDIFTNYMINGKKYLDSYIDKLAIIIRINIMKKDVYFRPIKYSLRYDINCRKYRTIAVESIEQQIYNYICVNGLNPILKRIGEYQIASIPGRGIDFGIRTIQKWLRESKKRNIHLYACKLDVKKCFESITVDNVLRFLNKYIKNPTLMWVISCTLSNHENGLNIGSYLSQWLCNLYMSQLYHYISEGMKKFNGRVYKPLHIKHTLFYMDDILLLDTNKRNLDYAINLIQQKAREIELTIVVKDDIFPIYHKDPKRAFVDMLGMRISADKLLLKSETFIRARRSFIRALKKIDNKKILCGLDKRCLSYYGLLKKLNNKELLKSLQVSKVIAYCKKSVRYESMLSKFPFFSRDFYSWWRGSYLYSTKSSRKVKGYVRKWNLIKRNLY